MGALAKRQLDPQVLLESNPYEPTPQQVLQKSWPWLQGVPSSPSETARPPGRGVALKAKRLAMPRQSFVAVVWFWAWSILRLEPLSISPVQAMGLRHGSFYGMG